MVVEQPQVGRVYSVTRPRGARHATIHKFDAASDKVYVGFVGQDKRLDAWVPRRDLLVVIDEPTETEAVVIAPRGAEQNEPPTKKRKVSELPIEVQRLSGYNGSPPPNRDSAHGHGQGDASVSQVSTPEREHASMTRVRNFEDVRFGDYLMRTWYHSPYPFPDEESSGHSVHDTPTQPRKRQRTSASPASVSMDTPKASLSKQVTANASATHLRKPADMFTKGVEVTRGRLWVCDLCFKYMKEKAAWKHHTAQCTQLQPPGRKVYQRGSYTIWEIDGADARLYCQNLSLFGKLFIDHKTVFFYVENFKYYVLCDAATSKRDQVMGFFSKEKVSYDDYNLACIVTFPPYQNKGFGKLLMEFSYYLTQHPSTRPVSLSPGTPERPLSDLGLKGYTAYWTSKVLRLLRQLLEVQPLQASPVKADVRARRSAPAAPDSHLEGDEKALVINDIAFQNTLVKTHHTLSPSLSDIAKACHLRLDDTTFTLETLGLLQHTRHREQVRKLRLETESQSVTSDDVTGEQEGKWKDREVVITRGMVLEACEKWKVQPSGVLDEQYVLL